MKKFNAKQNMGIVVMGGFKNSIESAVHSTERGRNEITSDCYVPSHIATVITFNPTNQEVEYFSIREFVNSLDENDIDKLIASKIKRISSQGEYSQNELVAVIKTREFEYHGYVGYVSEKERELRDMKMQNKFMSLYIDIISSNVKLDQFITRETEEEALKNGTSIDKLSLSMRSSNCLKRAGYYTIEKLRNASLEDMCRVRNLGRRSLEEIEEVLGMAFA